jgi:hypothetical protein
MRHLLPLLIALLSFTTADAQRQRWYLNEDFGLRPTVDLDRTLTEAGLTYDQACAKYPRWCERWRVKAEQAGWTVQRDRETFVLNTTFTAAYQEAYFQGQMHNLAVMTSASANIDIPWGEYRYSTGLYQPIGTVSGNGTFAGGLAMGSTVISPAHERWNPEPGTDPTIRTAFTTAKCGVAGNAGYAESMTIQNLRLEGRKYWQANGDLTHPSYWMVPTYTAHGIDACGPGESYRLLNIQSNNWNGCGIRSDGATPLYADHITVFKNAVAGFQLAGAALGTGYIGLISGDENPYLVDWMEGDKGDRGGQWFIAAIKSEGGTNIPTDMNHPWVGQVPLRIRGQAGVDIGVISAATTHYRIHSAIIVDNRLACCGGAPQTMSWRVGSIKSVGSYEYLVADLSHKLMWKGVGNYAPGELTYLKHGNAAPEVTFHRKPLTSEPYPLNDRLGYATGTTQFNVLAGTPPFSYTKPGTVTPPPPPPTPCTYTTGAWSAWSTCTNNQQIRTRTVTATPAGCTGTAPAATETQACTVAPPPPPPPVDPPAPIGTLPLSPADVVVVVNANDPNSRALADAYKAAWGTTREVVLNLGSNHSIGTTAFNTERNKLSAIPAQALALCFTVPTRVNEVNGITSAFTYGYSTSWTSTGSGYGRPSAAIKRAVLVNDLRIIQAGRASTGTKPTGSIYVVLANDGGGTAPRGDARAPQVIGAAGDRIRARLPQGVQLVVQDNRKGCAGECPGNELVGKSDVLAYFGSMYKVAQWGTNTVRPGAYADNLTSTSGNLPTGQGQTPITAFAPAFSSGTVVEPWMSSSTNTARQFMRVDTFSVSYFGQARSFAEAAYRSVERPWRLLIVGDPLAAPYADVQPTTPVQPPAPVDPTPVDPPPTGSTLGRYTFTGLGSTTSLSGSPGPTMLLEAGAAQRSALGLEPTESYTRWNTGITTPVSTIILTGFVPRAMEFQYLFVGSTGRGIMLLPDGSIIDNTIPGNDIPLLPPGTVRAGQVHNLTITITTPRILTAFGAATDQGNCWSGTMQGVELR